MEEGWWGRLVAQARARGWCTGDGGSTSICGGEVVASGVPANEAPRNHVSGVPWSKGSSGSLTWRTMVECGALTRRVDLARVFGVYELGHSTGAMPRCVVGLGVMRDRKSVV